MQGYYEYRIVQDCLISGGLYSIRHMYSTVEILLGSGEHQLFSAQVSLQSIVVIACGRVCSNIVVCF